MNERASEQWNEQEIEQVNEQVDDHVDEGVHYGWKTVISSDEAKIFSSSIALELFDISNTIQEHATKVIRALVTVIFCQNLNPNRPPYAKKEK